MKTINKSENHSEKKQHKTWYKLDLSANVYPTLQRRNFSNVFRLSVDLKEEIDPDTLQRALHLTLPRFPAFKVALHKGIFWRYLEPNDHPGPFVMPDIINPCMPMLFKSNNRYLIRIYYYRCRISLEVFHSLSDGSGALKLLIEAHKSFPSFADRRKSSNFRSIPTRTTPRAVIRERRFNRSFR